ncbi:glycoside hydrolase family 113 [Pantoea stewartii]|uniref:glycoside hydrolase family 113 n=1 Tax=Pantoea stewartii TaxID=66269 RepID=UPI00138FD616|nr:hypothetical protein [Pantoea stewartii]
MEKLGITSNFTVSGFDEHGVGYPVVDAHFILDMDGNPIVDPVPGGSQSFNIHLADGTVLSGVEANPNNWLVGPYNYTFNDAISFANEINQILTETPTDDSFVSSYELMTMAFVRGGSEDLQRGTAWGIPSGLAVPAFIDVASFHLGLVTSISGLSMASAELGGGVYNLLSNSLDTSGIYGLSLSNEISINAGYKLGNDLLQGKTDTPNETYESIIGNNVYTTDVMGDTPVIISTTSDGIQIVAGNNQGNPNGPSKNPVNASIGDSIVVNGLHNIIEGDDLVNITINGIGDYISVGNYSEVKVTGVGNVVTAGIGSNVSIYGNPSDTTQLTESIRNTAEGTSQVTSYNNILGSVSSTTDTFTGLNGLGNITEHQVNNLDGTSTDTSYQTQGPILSSTNYYSGTNDTGTLTETVKNFTDGTSTDTAFGPSATIESITNTYSGPDKTGELTNTLTNRNDGTSSLTSYSTDGSGFSVTNSYAAHDATGALTESLVNHADGTSEDTVYNQQGGSWTSVTDQYSGKNDTGSLINSLVNNADGTSTNTVFGMPGGNLFSMKDTYSKAFGTGELTTTEFNFNDGTSEVVNYNPSSNFNLPPDLNLTPNLNLTSITQNFSLPNATGTVDLSLFNTAPNGLGSSSYTPSGDNWGTAGAQLNFDTANLTVPNFVSVPSFSENLLNGAAASYSFTNFTADSLQTENLAVGNWISDASQYSFDAHIPDIVTSDLYGGLSTDPGYSGDDSGEGDNSGSGGDSGDGDNGDSGNDSGNDSGDGDSGGDSGDGDNGGGGDNFNQGGGGDGSDAGGDGGGDGGGDPLVMSLDGHPIQLIPLNLSHAVVNIAGQSSTSGWIGSDTGVLAIVTSAGTQIINPSLVNGAGDAMAVLASYDLNKDGVIDASDVVFSQLRVLADPTGNGSAQAQAYTLSQLGIQSIRLQNETLSVNAQGNQISGVATVIFSNGSIEPIENVNFAQGSSNATPGWNGTVNPVWQQILNMIDGAFNSSAYSVIDNGSLPDGANASSTPSQIQQVASNDNTAIMSRISADSRHNGIVLADNTKVNINGSNNSVTVHNSDSGTINGGNFALAFEGNGSAITTNGNNEVVTAGGSGNSITANGDKNIIVISGVNNSATTSNSTVLTSNSTQAVVNGLSNIVGLGNNDNVTTNGNSFTSAIQGNSSTLTANGNNNQILITGNNDTVWANGSGDVVVMDGQADTANVGGGSVFFANDSQGTVNGSVGVVRAGSNENLQVNGSGFSITTNGTASQIVANGDGNNIITKGSKNTLVMNGGSAVMTTEGDTNSLTVNGDNAKFFVEGNSNTLAANGKGDTVYIKGQGEDVTLSGGTAILADNDSLTINGGNDTVAIGNNESLTANGGEYNFYLQADNSSVTSNGDDETVFVSGNNDNFTANGQHSNVEISGQNDSLTTGGAQIVLSDASQLTLNGNNDAVHIGNADLITVNGGGSTLLAEGSASYITANGDKEVAIVKGVNNTITLNGAKAVVTVVGNNNMLTANGPSTWIQMQGENNDIVANGPGDIVLLQGENSKLTIGDGTVAVSDDTQATLSGVDDSVTLGNRDNDTINGGDFVINLTGQQSTVVANGDREVVTIKGNQNTFTTNGGHSFNVVSGNNDSITANGDMNNIDIHGQQDVIYANGSGDDISLDGSQDDLHTSGNSVSVKNNTQAWLNGGGNKVFLSDNDNVSINGSGYTLNFNGAGSSASLQGDWSNITLNGSGNTFTANGNSDSIQMNGNGNSVSVNGTGGEVSLTGTGQTVVMENGSVTTAADAQAVLQGHGNIITAGKVANVEVDGGDNWINAQATDTVLLKGNANGAGFSGDGGQLTVDGNGQYALMNSGNAVLEAGASLNLSGNNNTVTAASNGSLDISGTGNVLHMTSSSLTLDSVSSNSNANSGFQVKGFGFTSSANGQYANASESLKAMQQTGANSTQIVVTQYLDSVTGDSIAATAATESDANLELAIGQAQADGMSVLLKPHIDIEDGTWRALLKPSNVDDFFASYKTFILHYAAIAQATHVSMFSVGTELTSMSGSAYTNYWNDIISAVRQVYTGPITYASAWNETGSVSFWNKVDVIGANAYEAPTDITDPTVAQMVAGWNSVSADSYTASLFNNLSPIDFYHSLSTNYGKPVLLTEVGYRSVNGTNTLNGDWSGFHWVDFQQQTRALEAFFEAWSGQGSWMEGAYLWNWEANPSGVAADDFSVQGKPAQNVVDHWYGGSSAATAASSNILNGDFNTVLMGQGDTLTVNGNTDTVTMTGNDLVTLNGTTDNINVYGKGNVLQAGTTTSVTLSNDNSALMVSGTAMAVNTLSNNNALAYTGNQSVIKLEGDSNTVVIKGDSNAVMLEGKNQLISVSGQNNSITVTGDNSSIVTSGVTAVSLAGNQIQTSVQGSGDAVTVSGNGDSLTITGSTDTVSLNNTGTLSLNITNATQDDALQFMNGISIDQVWFSQSGNTLVASVIGTHQEVDVNNWFGAGANQLQIKSGDGHALVSSQLDNLISAMATMTPPAIGQTTLSQDQMTQLKPSLDAAWN